jgi:hypothetical protein
MSEDKILKITGGSETAVPDRLLKGGSGSVGYVRVPKSGSEITGPARVPQRFFPGFHPVGISNR